MDDCCDSCGSSVPAQTWWWRAEDRAELAMCAHHAKEHGDALKAAGFRLARERQPEPA